MSTAPAKKRAVARAPAYSLLAADYDRELGAIFPAFQRPFLASLLHRHPLPRGDALDLGCGTGRVACHLAARGFTVTAMDLSAWMLAVARRRRGSASVRWIEGDITRLRLGRRFVLVTCNFDVLNHLLRESQVRAVMRAVRRHLQPGGLFVFDVNTRHALATRWSGLTRVIERREYTSVWRGAFDHRRGLAMLSADYFLRRADRGYQHACEIHRQRAYANRRLRQWLADAGLQVVDTYVDGRWRRPERRSLRVAFVSRRPATDCR